MPGRWAGCRRSAAHFVALQLAAGLPVRFQIGEPWWWAHADGRICLYDDAAQAAFGGSSARDRRHARGALDAAQTALLDEAGALLAASTAAIWPRRCARRRRGAAEVLLLVFTPTVLDPAMPELRRANMPLGLGRAGLRPAAAGGL